MCEKSALPLPQTSPSRTPKSRSLGPRILLTLLASLLLVHSAPSLFSQARPALSLAKETARDLFFQDGEFDWSALGDVQCPVQPAPLFPKMLWNLTEKEKKRSTELYSQAVVGVSRISM
jgi:Gly-Xaa carboxypeptidase